MGSFCIECGVSGQVIADDDKCLAIPIIQQSTFRPVEMTLDGQAYSLYGVANSTCYPGAHWAPIGGFVTGKYADYGRIEADDTPTNRRAMVDFFVELVRNAPVVAQGENSCHDIPFDIKAFIADKAPVLAERLRTLRRYDHVDPVGLDFTELATIWEHLWDVTHEHRLFCRDHSSRIRPLQFAAFHRVSFDHLVQYTNGLKGWHGESYELGAYLKRQLEELSTEAAGLTDEDAGSKKFFLRMRLRDQLSLHMSDCVHKLLLPYMGEHLDLLDKHLDEGVSLEDYIEAMRPSMEGVYALKGMECLNLKFSPVVYAGQDYDNTQGREVAKFVSAVSKEITKQRKKRCNE